MLLLKRKDISLNKPNRGGFSPLGQVVMLSHKAEESIIFSGFDKSGWVSYRTIEEIAATATSTRQKSAEMAKALLTRRYLDLNHCSFRPVPEAVHDGQTADQKLIIPHVLSYHPLNIEKCRNRHAELMRAIRDSRGKLVALLCMFVAINNVSMQHSRVRFERAVMGHDVSAARRILEANRDLVNEVYIWKDVFRRRPEIDTDRGDGEIRRLKFWPEAHGIISTAIWYSAYHGDERMAIMLLQKGVMLRVRIPDGASHH